LSVVTNPHVAFAVFGLLAINVSDLRRALLYVLCLVLAVTVHEFAHAFAAHRLGDPTPEGQGRLTLNPVAHVDPIGTLLLPVVLGLMSPGMLFGWGRPVQTQSRYYTRKITMRAGMALVAFAGPLSNLLLASLTLLFVFVLKTAGVVAPWLTAPDMPVVMFFQLNLVLFAFNLIPLHPLDGGKVLGWLLGSKYQHVDDFLARYGGMILLVLVFVLPQVLYFLLGPVIAVGHAAFRAVL
jgi:Zn-dependent protease